MAASDNFFQKAEQALKKKNYDYAVAMYLQGLSIDPDRPEERKKCRASQVASVQEKGGSTLGGGMFKIKNAKTLGTAKKLGMQKKYEEQIVEIEKILSLAPQYAPALMAQGEAFEATNRITSAVQSYTWVTQVDPKNPSAWKALAKLHEGQKDFEEAVKCWERVKAVAPEDAEAGKSIRDLSAAVMMAQTEARQAAAKDDSFRAMLKSEDDSEALQKSGQMIRTADDAEAAIQMKKDEIKADAANSRLYRELGDLYSKVKQFDNAEAAFRKASEVNPEDMYTAEKLGTLTEQRIQSAIEDAKIAVQKNPEDATAKATLEKRLADQNEFMLTELERRVAAHPTDFALKSRYGVLLFKNERWDDAIGQFQSARKDPKFATESTANIGRCFLKKGVFSLAIKELESAQSTITDQDNDRWKSTTYDLAVAYEANGDVEKALALFEEIMSVDINYRDVSQRADALRNA